MTRSWIGPNIALWRTRERITMQHSTTLTTGHRGQNALRRNRNWRFPSMPAPRQAAIAGSGLRLRQWANADRRRELDLQVRRR